MNLVKLEKELADDPNICVIYRQEPPQFNVRTDLWLPQNRISGNVGVRVIRDFLQSPLIVDRFDNDTDRRNWKYGLSPELEHVYRSTSLRLGNLSGVDIGFMLIYDAYPDKSDKDLFRLLFDIPSEVRSRFGFYTSLSNSEKLDYVSGYSRAGLDVLEFLSSK